MKDNEHRVARRGFLAGAGVLAAAAGATALAPRMPAGPSPAAVPDLTPKVPDDNKGYRVSEHIRKYYRTTLV